jgi:adenylosuccinate synthase
MRTIAVIGANFGDEGKGLCTDYLCAGSPRAVAVRFNGGAQAGHTVQLADGYRHVFGHYGAGTLAGADTYLSRFFLVNPLLWAKEVQTLRLPPGQRLLLHPDAPLTTPYDMYLNQAAERARGGDRHGSCGAGVNETVTRGLYAEYATCAWDLANPSRLKRRLQGIRTDWVPARAGALGLDAQQIMQELAALDLETPYFAACTRLWVAARFAESLAGYDTVVFEGAQGLLLDEQSGYFPHVTRSRTGLTNVAVLLDELFDQPTALDEAVYVSRGYLTRHGAGPFPTERATLRYADPTNAPNEWQGALRFGPLDELLLDRVTRDSQTLALTPSLALTCLDQLSDPGRTWLLHAADQWLSAGQIARLYTSFGPTRQSLRLALTPTEVG